MAHQILASLFLLLLLVAPAAAFEWGRRGTSFTRFQFLLWISAMVLTRWLWRAQLPAAWPKEIESGGIIVCNHRSSIDPFFLQVCRTEPMHWLVAREYVESPWFGWFLRACEVIPVNRSGIDTAATRAAIRHAQQGHLVGLFPEGRINQTERFLLSVRAGAALIALRARKPILPCYIEGSPFDKTPWSPFFMPARVRVAFGNLVDLTPYYNRADDNGVSREIMHRVTRELARIAGREDFDTSAQ